VTSSPPSESGPSRASWSIKPSTWPQHLGIGLILALFVILGCIYSLTTPILETPDETGHFDYVRWFADGKGLPSLPVSEDPGKQGELHQPPLYYAIGAMLTGGIDAGPTTAIYERNPFAAYGVPHSQGNKNAVLHLGGEAFPYQGVSLAVHLLRWFSLVCSGVTVLLTYAIALEIAPQHRAIATGAAALAAFCPQFLFISAGVNNDSLVTLLATLALYLGLRVCNGKGHPYRTPIALGACVGLAALSKVSGLATAMVIPFAYAAHAHSRHSRRFWQDLLRPILIATATALAIGGWWYARNAILYQDILGMRTYRAVFSMNPEPLPLKRALRITIDSFISYWGVFGWMNILADELFYTLLRVLSALGLLGVLLELVRAWRKRGLAQQRWRAATLLALWVLVMLALLVRWSQTITRTQGRLLFPAIAAISFFLCLGLTAWIPRRHSGLTVVGFSAILFAFSLIAPFRYIAPAYACPKTIAADEVPATIERLEVSFGEEIALLGYDLDQDRISPGESLTVTLYWKALAPIDENYLLFIHLLGANQVMVAQIDTHPGWGNYPTSLWRPGEVIVDTYTLPIPPAALTPNQLQFEVGLWRPREGLRLRVTDSTGADRGDNLRFGRISLPSRMLDGIPNPINYNLENRIALVGYELDRTAARPGESFHLTLYWRALRDGDTNYSVFTQVLGEGDRIWSQKDAWPQGGNSPTATWRKGDLIRDPYELVVVDDAPMGVYDLQVGMYDVDGTRLRVWDEDGRRQDTRILLGKVRIWGKDQ